jgi:hypothetical protein
MCWFWSSFVELDELIQKIYNLAKFRSYLDDIGSKIRKIEFKNMQLMFLNRTFEWIVQIVNGLKILKGDIMAINLIYRMIDQT